MVWFPARWNSLFARRRSCVRFTALVVGPDLVRVFRRRSINRMLSMDPKIVLAALPGHANAGSDVRCRWHDRDCGRTESIATIPGRCESFANRWHFHVTALPCDYVAVSPSGETSSSRRSRRHK